MYIDVNFDNIADQKSGLRENRIGTTYNYKF